MDEQLLEEVDAEQPAALAAFGVRDADGANWVVRKINESRAYAAKVASWAESEIKRARGEEEWFLARFGGELQDWLRAELMARGRRSRSVNLPAGRVGIRSVPARVQVIDMRSLAPWCREHLPAAIRVRIDAQGQDGVALLTMLATDPIAATVDERALVTEVTKHVQSTGEVPPGVGVSLAAERFYVE